MDHIDIPRGCIVDHTIDYSLPRACFVKELDLTAVIAVDTIEDGFGKRPFSSTSPYATTKFLSYIEQLAKLPNKASMSATEIPDMVGADGVQQPTEGATNKADGTTRNVHEPPPKNTEGGDDVCSSLEDWLHPLPAFDELELPPHMRAIFNKHKDIHAAELKGALSSFGSLLEGIYLKRMGMMLSEASKAGFRSDEAKHDVTFHAASAPAPGMCKATANDLSPQQQKKRDTNTGTVNASVTISSPQQPKQPNNLEQEEAQVEVSSGQGHDQKHPTLKRAAPTESTAAKLPKMKKKKIDAMDDAIYQRYCCTNYKIKDPPRGEPLPSFIRIGGFDISFKHFSNGLKKRAHMNNEVMSLYIESFNIEHMYSSSKPRKFAFSPHVVSKLCVDPSSFNTNSYTKDLKRACEKNDIAKADQLFFTIVKQDHWAVVVLNLIHKQFNVFDSNIRDSDYVSFLEKPCSNLIENFKTLNLTARGLKPFNTDTTSLLNFRKYIAAKLFKHPQNTLSSEEELEKLLKKS
uniref:Ubiquitin-like protease family profile domain-containing protein n=1 Tax=Hordeum vulgare subsp. vulgare TaxID=112509 RepID=A0A8I6YUT4_HORVV